MFLFELNVLTPFCSPSLLCKEGDGGEFMKFNKGKEVLFKIPLHPFKKTFVVFVRVGCKGV